MPATPFEIGAQQRAYNDALVPTLDVAYGRLARGILATVAGTITLVTPLGTTVQFTALAGVIYPIAHTQVTTAGTAATGLLALF